jgi:dTDP-4-amino-4,6-dideoxygalactose transaminase
MPLTIASRRAEKNSCQPYRKQTLTNVTKPFLPPLSDILPSLEEIWESGWLSNSGPFHQSLEAELASYLEVPHVSLFCNATIALITAQQALAIEGEVITTPYSFVATTHALHWMRNTPVFVDVEPGSFTLNPEKIEAAITERTAAIMPMHCYGNTCDTDAIRRIAEDYSLPLIYDACHSFGVRDLGGSVLSHGDISVVSFHATKVFNTFEGGLLVSGSEDMKQRVDNLKNFGFVDETTVIEPGINGKMSEFNAMLGLHQLKYMPAILQAREQRDSLYRRRLGGLSGIRFHAPARQIQGNYAYFPIFVEDEFPLSRDELYDLLKQQGISGRRYFYPLISEFPMYCKLPSADLSKLPVAFDASRRVICLPLYPDLDFVVVGSICDTIEKAANA